MGTFFQEEKVPEEFFHHNPDPESIYRFIRPFFIAYKATGGYAITTLVRQFFFPNFIKENRSKDVKLTHLSLIITVI